MSIPSANILGEAGGNQRNEVILQGNDRLPSPATENLVATMSQSEQRIVEILESITDAFYAVDAAWRLTYVNRKTEAFWRCQREQLLGKVIWDIFPNPAQNFGFQELQRAARERTPVSFENFSPVLCIWVEAQVYPTADGGLSVYFRDITARKQAEEKNRAQFAIFRGIIESCDNPIFSLDTNYRYTSFNKAHHQMMQHLYAVRIELGKNIFESQHDAEDGLIQQASLVRAFQGERFVISRYWGKENSRGKYYEITYNPIVDETAQVTGAAVFIQDITARKSAEAALENSETRFRAMFENHQAKMMLIEPDSGAIVDANLAAVQFYGFSRAQLGAMFIQDINRLNSAEVAALRLKTLNEQRGHFIFPHRLADGAEKWVEVYSTPIDIQGTPLLFSVIHDITDRKIAEEELCAKKISLEAAQRESEQRYQDLFRDSPAALILHDGERILEVNPATLGLLGYASAAEIRGRRILERVHPEDLDRMTARIRAIAREERALPREEIRLLKKDGTVIYTEAVDGICHYHGHKIAQSIFHDVTERKRAAEALRISEEKYKKIVETGEEGIWVIDPGWKTSFMNTKMAEMLGFQPNEILGASILNFVFFEECEELHSHLQKRLQGITERYDFRFRKKDGSELWVIVNTAPIYDEKGNFSGVLAMLADITERKRLELSLAARTSELSEVLGTMETILSTIPVGVVVAETSTEEITYVSPAALEIVGVPLRGTATGPEPGKIRSIKMLRPDLTEIPPDEWPLARALRKGETTDNEEIILRRSDGREVTTVMNCAPVRDDNGRIVRAVGSMVNITKRKQIENALRESEEQLHRLNKQVITRLEEERGMIARELHDEAGQALTALKIFIELILDELSTESGVRQRIAEAVELTDRTMEKIRRLAQELRPPALDALGLNLTLEGFCQEFSKQVDMNIRYQGCDLPALNDTIRISLYRFLQEALTNVVKHARADLVEVRLSYNRHRIILQVKDNGIGFEPSPAEPKGRGMGLVGMRERLAMLGGELSIASQPGLGTRLVASIPWEAVQ